jgi:kynurenine formamidase
MMMTANARVLAPLLLCCALTTQPAVAEDWIDLTYPLSEETIFWPTAQRFELRTDFAGHTQGGYYYSAYTFTTAEHGGTHIDAPVHFAEGRHSVDQIPLDRLIGEAVVLDLSKRIDGNCKARVTTKDIRAWEKSNGEIARNSIVLLRTGFGDYWPDAARYLGTDLRGDDGVKALCFPGLHPDAAAWLAQQREIKSVGIDTASIDYGASKDFAAHVNLMTRNIPAFENVANLHRLPARGVYVIALPTMIAGGSGGPLRIVAKVRAENPPPGR